MSNLPLFADPPPQKKHKDHGFEFESSGRLAHMPGAGPPKSSAAAAKAAARPAAANAKACSGHKAPTYPAKEIGGWIYIFPDETRPGSVEQHRDPVVIPEALSPEFRTVEGSMDFKGGVDASVENSEWLCNHPPCRRHFSVCRLQKSTVRRKVPPHLVQRDM